MSGGDKALKLVNAIWKTMQTGSEKGFDKILKPMVIISASEGTCSAEITVTEDLVNRGSSLHGGCSATLVDIVSTLALMTNTNNSPGVSVNLNMSYLRSAKLGETIIIDSQTVKLGKSLAFLEAQIKKKSNGDIIATGTHTKFIGS